MARPETHGKQSGHEARNQRAEGDDTLLVTHKVVVCAVENFPEKLHKRMRELGLTAMGLEERMGMTSGLRAMLGRKYMTMSKFRDMTIGLEKPLSWWGEEVRYGTIPSNHRHDIRQQLRKDIDEALRLISRGVL